MTFGRICTLLALIVAGIYAFVTAPQLLAEGSASGDARSVSIATVFDTVDAINAATRKLYTEEVVGKGSRHGLRFAEEWRADGVDAGPLPALFLRLVAEKLQVKSPQLGLFLGSDKPISPSNLFTGQQDAAFQALKSTDAPQLFAMPDGFQVAMYADIASAGPCVTCHNDHKDSPKKDWRLNDIMGATTWTFQRATVSTDEYRQIVRALCEAIEEAYGEYLKKARTFRAPPQIGEHWPGADRLAVPDAATMMKAVYAATSPLALRALLVADVSTPSKATP
jgi:adenylate cyclase